MEHNMTLPAVSCGDGHTQPRHSGALLSPGFSKLQTQVLRVLRLLHRLATTGDGADGQTIAERRHSLEINKSEGDQSVYKIQGSPVIHVQRCISDPRKSGENPIRTT